MKDLLAAEGPARNPPGQPRFGGEHESVCIRDVSGLGNPLAKSANSDMNPLKRGAREGSVEGRAGTAKGVGAADAWIDLAQRERHRVRVGECTGIDARGRREPVVVCRHGEDHTRNNVCHSTFRLCSSSTMKGRALPRTHMCRREP